MALPDFLQTLSPEETRRYFFFAQIGIGALVLLALLRSRSGPASGFRSREADTRGAPDPAPAAGKPPTRGALANAKLKPENAPRKPLQLEGIRIDGAEPHEILGIAAGADETTIQKAYRERMKQYHPDRVGPPGSRQWQDAQQIAHAVTEAKNQLIERARRRR